MLKSIIILCYVKFILCLKPKFECGYKQCPVTRDGALNVHLVPHSHLDAGWVKTFDEYYYGTKTQISTANVQLIFHSVLSELLHDKRRKFTFSETAYFWRWWKEQRPVTRATFRTLVQEGRLEFAGGSWVQNDEASVDYLQIIDQYTWGLRKLNDTLGPCGKPKAAWQIDTYGHTREQASLLAQMGYDGLFIGRVDDKVRDSMIDEDRMEFMWRGSDVLGKMSDIMSHTLFNLYNAPDGFCFDFLCNDEPIIDDPENIVNNAEKRVSDFISQIERQAKYYEHDNIMVTMGGDFTYQNAANWYMNMDKLINHINTHTANISDINIFYSTPSCYLKALYLFGKRDKAIYTEKGDYLPYGSDPNTYWTGFYTSRPSIKYLAKRAHIFLQVLKQMSVISRTSDTYELHLLRHAVSLVLHHDAITGTSQQHVSNNFVKILSDAIEVCTKKMSMLLSSITQTWGGSRRSKNTQQFDMCHQLNMSQCRMFETQESVVLVVYNPSSVSTYHHIRLPAVALHYTIRDFNDEEVDYQLVPLPTAIINLPGRSSNAMQDLCFEAENIPPLGFSSFYITHIRDPLEEVTYKKKPPDPSPAPEQEVTLISNEYIKIYLNKETGLLESIQHMDGSKVGVKQNFYYYSQMQQQTLTSGAYTFRTQMDKPTPVTEKVTNKVVKGLIVKEIVQRFSDWITQVIRLYRGEEFVELEWIVGPVPIGTDLGKEVVSVFSTNISNNGEFYTDSNARLMMKRSCWNESTSNQHKKPIPACYYPIVSRMCIQSTNSSDGMCILTDRTQGGTSYNEGEMELMVHRRLLTDDGFGLEESLNEEEYGVGLVVRGKHRILLGNHKQDVDGLSFSERAATAARKWMLEPWPIVTIGDKMNRRKWQNTRSKRFSALRLHGLPRHIHVLTLEPWKGGAVLLRLENTLEKTDRGQMKSDKLNPEDYIRPALITVELRKIFLRMQIRAVRETTLAANQWLDEARQMDWSTRYMYTGSDDGIMPEDNIDYNEEKFTNKKEYVPYSDEVQDREYTTKKNRRKTAKKMAKTKTDYRKKRSIIENNTYVQHDKQININKTKLLDFKISNITDTDIKRRKYKFVNRKTRPRVHTKIDRDSVETSAEYDVRKRQRYLKKNRQTDITLDSSRDDGVTKSIYEMYYKSRSKPRRNDERKREKNKARRSNRREEDISLEYKDRKIKKKMPFIKADKRREDSLEERRYENDDYPKETHLRLKRRKECYDSGDYDSEEADTDPEDREGRSEKKRKKRELLQDEDDPQEEQDDTSETEHVITLRPTQIRTFIVWFESKAIINK